MLLKNEAYAEILAKLSTGISILEAIRTNGLITDFKWLYVNKASEKIANCTWEELQFTTLFQKYPELRPFLHQLANVVESGITSEGEVYHPVADTWVFARAKKFNDGYLSTLQDITAKKALEKKAAINEKLFSTLFQNSGLGIAVVNSQVKFTMANGKLGKMLQYSKEELTGKNLQDFYYKNDEDNGYEKYLQVLNKEIPCYEIEKRYVRRDGTVFWGLLTVSLLELDDMENAVIGVIQDIDARKKAEEALQHLNEELRELDSHKDKVLAITAHDLKSPFISLTGYFNMIIEDFEMFDKEELRRHLSAVQHKSLHIHDLLEELLAWSQSVLNKLHYNLVEVDLKSEFEKKVKRFKSFCDEKHINIVLKLGYDNKVRADVNMLRAILRNLISNAIKFSPDNTTITIESAPAEDNNVMISIIDQGTGMKEETLNKLLTGKAVEPTYGTGGDKGLGLGLSICRDFIEKNKGKLFIENNKDKGCRFSFTLPKTNYTHHKDLILAC